MATDEYRIEPQRVYISTRAEGFDGARVSRISLGEYNGNCMILASSEPSWAWFSVSRAYVLIVSR